MRGCLKFFLFLLLVLCVAGSALSEPAAEPTARELIEELAVYYGTYGDGARAKTGELLEQLRTVDPVAGAKWEHIMKLWESVNTDPGINESILPDGLPDTDELCLVVLGFQLNPDGTMRDELVERLKVALSCARKYPSALVVCTGGGTASGDPSATEAGRMAGWLLENGVEPDRIEASFYGLGRLPEKVTAYIVAETKGDWDRDAALRTAQPVELSKAK